MTLYKFTRAGGLATYADGYAWDRPRGKRPGKWQPPIVGELVPCENGYHLCRTEHLVRWCSDELWVAQTKDPEPLDAGDKVVVRTARLVSRVETWNERTARLFAADCAERVLPIFEAEVPGDVRPRRAVEVARAYARGEIGAAARAARAARAAAGAAQAARAAAGAARAARAAAWAAADAAAGAAADAAAGDAARDARAAAWAAAWAATGDAAWDAAWAAAWDAAREWQTLRLLDYLEGRAS